MVQRGRFHLARGAVMGDRAAGKPACLSSGPGCRRAGCPVVSRPRCRCCPS